MINKKYLSDYFKVALFLLVLAIIFAFCYKRGMDSVRREVIGLGYASEKDGELLFKSRRAIEQGE